MGSERRCRMFGSNVRTFMVGEREGSLVLRGYFGRLWRCALSLLVCVFVEYGCVVHCL